MNGRIFLGLDVGPDELRAVALHRTVKKQSVLIGTRRVPLEEGVLRIALREPNVLRPERFVEAVRRILNPLVGHEDRLAVTLGAGTGLVIPAEMESTFKNRSEGEDLLRWQLKNLLPVDPADMRVDFQVLEKTDAGRSLVLAGAMVSAVLEQYEALFIEAGFNPVNIDFHLLSLLNFYRPRFDFGNDFILMMIESREIGLLYFQGGISRFFRARQMKPNSGRLVQELHRSLVTCHDEFPASARVGAFLHGSDPRTETLRVSVSEIFGREVILLKPHQEMTPGLELENYHSLAAAIGAAEGLMWSSR